MMEQNCIEPEQSGSICFMAWWQRYHQQQTQEQNPTMSHFSQTLPSKRQKRGNPKTTTFLLNPSH